MFFLSTIRMSFSNLRANAMRTFLTMLGVIIGITSILALLTIGQGVTDSVIESDHSLVIPEAANREISATVVLKRLLEGLK